MTAIPSSTNVAAPEAVGVGRPVQVIGTVPGVIVAPAGAMQKDHNRSEFPDVVKLEDDAVPYPGIDPAPLPSSGETAVFAYSITESQKLASLLVLAVMVIFPAVVLGTIYAPKLVPSETTFVTVPDDDVTEVSGAVLCTPMTRVCPAPTPVRVHVALEVKYAYWHA